MRALINFDLYYKGEKEKEKTYVFVASGYEGEIRESEEMKPVWFELQSLPYDKMFSDDIYWLPSLLEGKTFTGAYLMDNGLEIPCTHRVDYHKQNDYASRVLYLEEVK